MSGNYTRSGRCSPSLTAYRCSDNNKNDNYNLTKNDKNYKNKTVDDCVNEDNDPPSIL